MPGVQNRMPRALRPLVRLDSVSLREAASAVVSHIRRMTTARGGVGYVYIHRRAIYVVHGDSPRADAWWTRRDMQRVGCYGTACEHDVVLDDLAECLTERPLTSMA